MQKSLFLFGFLSPHQVLVTSMRRKVIKRTQHDGKHDAKTMPKRSQRYPKMPTKLPKIFPKSPQNDPILAPKIARKWRYITQMRSKMTQNGQNCQKEPKATQKPSRPL